MWMSSGGFGLLGSGRRNRATGLGLRLQFQVQPEIREAKPEQIRRKARGLLHV